MRKFLCMMMALVLNAFVGSLGAMAIGVPPVSGAIAANGIAMLAGNLIPHGTLGAGVLTEVWTGEMIKKLRAGDVATFLDGLPDYSVYAENDVIHLVDVGADPEVLINNTTYPISVQQLTDSDAVFALDKFQTKPTSITDDELFALSYDKMASVKERHGAAILEAKYMKAIHAIAPAGNGDKTPVLKTTGEAENGRKMITRKDIIAMKKKFDKMGIPLAGRRLVLCNDHVNDLLAVDQKFADQYYNYTSGKISNLYGFEVYEFVNNPYYKGVGETADQKMPIGVIPAETDFQASVAFYAPRMFKASGSTKMYYSEASTDPENQRNLINFRHYYIVLPKKMEAIGAIISAQA